MIWIVRIAIVLVMLVIFLRRSSAAWGVGLLTAALVVLLDVMRVQGLLADAGFLSYLLGGVILAGGAFWFSAVLAVLRQQEAAPAQSDRRLSRPKRSPAGLSGFDREQIAEQMRTRLGYDDVIDVIFDLDIPENSVLNPAQSMPEIVDVLLNEVEATGNEEMLVLAVERILTPVPVQNLPRPEKLTPDTPPFLLRQYLIAHYSLAELESISSAIGVDWEEMGSDAKSSRVRRLLLYVKRRSKLPQLIAAMHARADVA